MFLGGLRRASGRMHWGSRAVDDARAIGRKLKPMHSVSMLHGLNVLCFCDLEPTALSHLFL